MSLTKTATPAELELARAQANADRAKAAIQGAGDRTYAAIVEYEKACALVFVARAAADKSRGML